MAGLILNSLLVAFGALLLAIPSAFVAALTCAASGRRVRAAILLAGAATVALPPFLVANSWLEATADWRTSLGGEAAAAAMRPVAAAVLGLLLWPIPFFLILGDWSRLQAAHLEAEPRLSGFRLARHLLLPACQPALRVGATLVLTLALANFTVPTLFQVRVFTEEFWIRFNTDGTVSAALRSTWPVVLLPLAALAILRQRPVSWPRLSAELPHALFRRRLGAGFVPVAAGTAVVFLLSLGFPLFSLASNRRTWTELAGALEANLGATWITLATAGSAAVVVVAVALCVNASPSPTTPAGRPPRNFVLLASWLGFLLPGVFIGLALIGLFNRPAFAAFYGSSAILAVAFGLRYLAPAWSGVASCCQAMDRELVEMTRLAGATPWQRFRIAIWPQVSRGTLTSAYLVFLLCLWDVETAVLIQPPGGQTLALRIFNFLHYGHSTQVNALCVVILAVAMLPILAGWAFLRGNRWRFARPNASVLGTFQFIGWGAALAFTAGCREHTTKEITRLESSRIFSGVRILGERGVAPGQFTKPRSLVCDRDDNLYVSDMTGRVQKFDPEGHFLLQWQMPQTDLGKPKGLGLDREGLILVLEPHYQRVNHFTTDGQLVRQWGRRGTNVGEFILPRGIAQNSRGDFYLPEYTVLERVQRFAADRLPARERPADPATEAPLSTWGSPGIGPGEFNRAESLAIGPRDEVFVVDSCNHRIQVFDPDGKFLRTYGKPGSNPGELSYPYDIKVDARGNQYICEFGNSRISVFDARDALIETIGGAGRSPGEFFNPWSIAFDSKGNLYVADSQNHRVQKLLRRQP